MLFDALFFVFLPSLGTDDTPFLACVCVRADIPTTQVPLTKDDWKSVLMWSGPILLVDELLKFIGRRLQAREKAAAAAAP